MKSPSKLMPTMGILLGAGIFGTAVVLAARHLIPIGEFGIIFLPGYLIYLWGCAALSRAKGFTATTGVLIGMFFTALLLFIMEDRAKLPKAQRDREDREWDEEDKARRVAKLRPLKGAQKAFVWLMGLFFFIVGLAMVVGYEIYWARVIVPEREGMATAISVSAEKLDPQNDGKLVHVTGALTGSEKLVDPEFGLAADAIRLRRTVWLYQWKEGNFKSKSEYGVTDEKGNLTPLVTTKGYNYTKEWSVKVIDSSLFQNAGHDNPTSKAVPDFAVNATNVSLGGFVASRELVDQLDNFQAAPVNETNLAMLTEPLRAKAKLTSDGIYFGADPANPAIGDMKVNIEFAPATTVSVIAQQNGNGLLPYAVAKSGSIAQLRVGTFSVQEMIGQFAKEESQRRMLVWAFGGFAILMGGLFIKVARRR